MLINIFFSNTINILREDKKIDTIEAITDLNTFHKQGSKLKSLKLFNSDK